MAGLQGGFHANSLGAHLDAKPCLTQQNTRPKAGFMKPFKIYENFRSAVYRGVRKNSSSVYEVCDTDDMGDYALEDEYDSVGSSSSSELGNECEIQRKSDPVLSSPESSMIGESMSHLRGPLLLAGLNDGNATDDSGIDSICCDNAVSPSGELPDQGGLGTLNELVEEETASDSDHGSYSRVESARGNTRRDGAHSDKAEMRQKSPGHKSFLYDTYAGARTLPKPKFESSVWKKELVISGFGNGLSGGKKSLHSSREDLCESNCLEQVELTSVKHRSEDTIDTLEDRVSSDSDTNISALYSSVIKSDKKKPVLQLNPDDNPAGTCKKCFNNDYCESHHTAGIRETNLPPAIEDTCHEDVIGAKGSTVVSKISLGTLRKQAGSNGTKALSQDLTDLSELLASTNHVLQRNSNLRASLTISVKKTCSVSRSGSSAKATSTPKNVRKTQAKSKTQKTLIKSETKPSLAPHWPTQHKEKMIGGSPHVKRKFAINSSLSPGSSDILKKVGRGGREKCGAIPEEGNLNARQTVKFNVGLQGEDHYLGCTTAYGDTKKANHMSDNLQSEEDKVRMGDRESDDIETRQLKSQMAENRNPPEDNVCSTKSAAFVRGYKGKNGKVVEPNGGYRMSMTIRPQTVANLATKFDTILKDKAPLSKSNSRQLKLKTYDITKIISELNKLNNDEDTSNHARKNVNVIPKNHETDTKENSSNRPNLSHKSSITEKGNLDDSKNVNSSTSLKERNQHNKSASKQDSSEPQSSSFAKNTVSLDLAGTTKINTPVSSACASNVHCPDIGHTSKKQEPVFEISKNEKETNKTTFNGTETVIEKLPINNNTTTRAKEDLLTKSLKGNEIKLDRRSDSAASLNDLTKKVVTPKQAANTHGPASRYLAALTPVKKGSGGTVSLGSGVLPSVRQTQRLLLMKTGGLLAEPHDSSGTKDDNQNLSSRRKQPESKETSLKKFQGVSSVTSTKDLLATNNISNISDKPNIISATSESELPKTQFKLGDCSETSVRKDSFNFLDPNTSSFATVTSDEMATPAQPTNKSHVPNSSFLWTKARNMSSGDENEYNQGILKSAGPMQRESAELPNGINSNDWTYDTTDFYDDVGVGSTNYQVIDNYKTNSINHSYMDILSAKYNTIGSRKSLASNDSYDDIKNPSIHSYFSISRSTEHLNDKSTHIYLSADNLSIMQYDDIEGVTKGVGPNFAQPAGDHSINSDTTFYDDEEDSETLHTSELVKATPAVILEDQSDSLSYIYDDIGSSSVYNGEMGLYESIAGSILNLAKSKLEPSCEDLYSLCGNDPAKDKAGANDNRRFSYMSNQSGPVEVFSYTLANMKEGQCLEMGSNGTYKFHGDSDTYMDNFSPRGSNRSSAPSFSTLERKSVTSDRSDEWVDIETDDDYEDKQFSRQVNFVRSSVRISNRRKFSRGSARLGHGWNRAVRDVSGTGNFLEHGEKAFDEEQYESIYEVIRPPESESDFEEIPEEETEEGSDSIYGKSSNSNLSKIAEAAGRKMKKLKTNWSIKKNDITRSLSKIKRNNRPIMDNGITNEGKTNGNGRRKVSRKLSNSNLNQNVPMGDDTMFYITLTIEEDGQPPINIIPGSYNDSDVDSNTYSQMSTDSGSFKMRSVTPSLSLPGNLPPPSRRKSSSKTPYSVIRPLVPPPAPPSNSSVNHKPVNTVNSSPPFTANKQSMDLPFHHMSSSSELSSSSSLNSVPSSIYNSSAYNQKQTDSLLLCDSLKEFYVGFCTNDNNAGLDLTGLPLTDIEETYTSSLFQTEPLYQFYDNDSPPSVSEDSDTTSEHDPEYSHENVYESVENLLSPSVRQSTRKAPKTSRCSAMDIVISNTGRRSLWAELPEVIESGLLKTISSEDKKLQEAMFEVISSEASYLKSLNILISHFVQSSKFSAETSVLSKRDQRILFSDVILVRGCSERFLSDLESRWQESVLLTGICDIIKAHAKENFQVYVKYCSNQVYQDRTLKRLKLESPAFVEALKELESSQACQSLAMHSFLMLPMQRITRLPLLTDAIASRLPKASSELVTCREALDLLNGLVSECNESARSMERMEELLILSQQLDFRDVKAIPLISASRWLVKRGDCTRISWKESAEKLTFGRRVHKHNLALFLFTDLLVVTKRKSDEKFLVLDYSPRNMIQVTELESSDGIPGLGEQPGFALWLTLLQNHEHKTQEMLLSFHSESDRGRWMEAVTPASSQIPGEKIYEDWDCPRVEAVETYKPLQNDEINLKKGEIANVLKKTSDGQKKMAITLVHNKANTLGTDDNNIEDECSRL